MRRRALALDHFAHRPRSRSGLALLALSIAAAFGLALWSRDLVDELEALQMRQPPALSRATAANATPLPEPQRLDDALRRAQRVSLEMRLPWTALFDAIEAAADPSVALLSIEPDARRTALRISGEARHKQAMLDYMLRLGARPPFVRAVLESHAQSSSGAVAPIRFTLLAHWEKSL